VGNKTERKGIGKIGALCVGDQVVGQGDRGIKWGGFLGMSWGEKKEKPFAVVKGVIQVSRHPRVGGFLPKAPVRRRNLNRIKEKCPR